LLEVLNKSDCFAFKDDFYIN